MPIDPRVSVGVAAIVARKVDGSWKVLLIKRKGKHASGLWAVPGGWLDFGEELGDATVRELREETGLEEPADRLEFVGYYNNIFQVEQVQSVTMHFIVHGVTVKEEPRIMEPEKCSEMRWFDFWNLPFQKEMFPGLERILKMAHKQLLQGGRCPRLDSNQHCADFESAVSYRWTTRAK